MRSHTIGIFISFIFVIILSACGLHPGPQAVLTTSSEHLIENSETVTLLPEKENVISIARVGNHLMLLADSQNGMRLFITSFSQSSDDSIEFTTAIDIEKPTELMYDISSSCFLSCDESCFYLLGKTSGNETSSEWAVWQYNADGKLLGRMFLATGDEAVIESFSAGPGGLIVLASEEQIGIYRWGEGILSTTELPLLAPLSASACERGVVISFFDRQSGTCPYYLVDAEKGNLSQLMLSEEDPQGDYENTLRRKSGSTAACQGIQGEYLINQGDCICLVDFNSDTLEKLVAWNIEQDSYENRIGPSCRITEHSFLCVLNGKLLLSCASYDLPEQRIIVRVAVIDGTPTKELEKTVLRQNRGDSPFWYSTSVIRPDDLLRVNAELASGAYDLIVFHDEINTASSLFEDLYPFLDTDPDLSRDDFLPHLLKSTEVNGQLHQLWNSVSIETYAARSDLINDSVSVTLSDCKRLVIEKESIHSLIIPWAIPTQFALEDAQKAALNNIIMPSLAIFVDKQSAFCRFDNEEFAGLLSICTDLCVDAEITRQNTLLNLTSVVSAYDAVQLSERLGAPVVYIGFPNGNGGYHYYNLGGDYYRDMSMAIPKNSEQKDGAWAFIHAMLSEKEQIKLQTRQQPALPVIYNVLRRYNDLNVKYEDATKLYDLLERTMYARNFTDGELYNLIMEACMPYLNGEKSLEETIKLVQSRASIYVAEKYS